MDRVYCYLRVSTDNQSKYGYSLAEQRAEVIKYCNDNGYEIVNIFEDAGKSGATANEEKMSIDGRDALIEMLSTIKDNNIKYVVVLNTSRLWRSDFVKVIINRELKRHKVDIKAIDRESYSIYKNMNKPSDILINGMFELLDEYERVEIALKLRRGRLQKAKDGAYAGGGAPYGYFCTRGNKVLQIEPKESEAVKRVFELKEYCPHLKLKGIAEILDNEGFQGRQGAKFNSMLVKRILNKEKFYRGVYRYGGIEVNEGKHEPIL